jgi:hypothetical protein
MRLMLSGSFGNKLEYFIETDNPNLGKAGVTGNTIIQDAVLTYKFTDKIKLDAGLILVPLSHNGTQSATNLHTWDYSAYAFSQSGPMGSSTGRDGGVQLRGIVGRTRGNLEFRVGAWQGRRANQVNSTPETIGTVASNNSFRFAGRAQWNFFDAEGGLFLGGAYLGAKKVLAIGVGHDRQDGYSATAVDVFMDLPIGNNGIMGQVNRVMWDNKTKSDGSTWLPNFPKQTTDFAELGFRFGKMFSPMVRYEAKTYDQSADGRDETIIGAGLAYWHRGHQSNLKLFYTRVTPKNPDGAPTLNSYDRINFQWQAMLW